MFDRCCQMHRHFLQHYQPQLFRLEFFKLKRTNVQCFFISDCFYIKHVNIVQTLYRDVNQISRHIYFYFYCRVPIFIRKRDFLQNILSIRLNQCSYFVFHIFLFESNVMNIFLGSTSNHGSRATASLIMFKQLTRNYFLLSESLVKSFNFA